MNYLKKLKEKEEYLNGLESELKYAYYYLGKRTQEFIEYESREINDLVEEIIKTKKEIITIGEKINDITNV